MAWASGQSLASGAKTANLVEFYVFGSTDAGKNLVSGTTRTATLVGSAAYGSDAIGSYVSIPGYNDALRIDNSAESAASVHSVFMLVYSRTGAQVGGQLVQQAPGFGVSLTGGGPDFELGANIGYSSGVAYTAAAVDTEFAILWDASNGRIYYTGGSAPVSTPAQNVNTSALTMLRIGNNNNENYGTLNLRARAYARWNSASGISQSDFQSIVDNPQQLLAAPTPPNDPTAGTATNLSPTGTATANWSDNSSDETGFEIESAPGPSFDTWSPQGTVGVGVTSRAMTGLATGDNRFRVRALGTVNSGWSTSATFVIPAWNYARPSSDGATKQWLTSSGSDYFSLLDETSPNASDYILANAAGLTGEIKFSMAVPQSGTSIEIGYAVDSIVGAGAVSPKLYVGATLVKTDTTRTANGTYTMTVTAAEYAGASAGDWANVTLRFDSV